MMIRFIEKIQSIYYYTFICDFTVIAKPLTFLTPPFIFLFNTLTYVSVCYPINVT